MRKISIIFMVLCILLLPGCHTPAASTAPTPSAMAAPPASTHIPTPKPKPTPAPAPTPLFNPLNTYETTGTVDGLICGLTLGMPMEEAEALLLEANWTRDEYPFGFVEYRYGDRKVRIIERGYAGPRGIHVGDDASEVLSRFLVDKEDIKTSCERGMYYSCLYDDKNSGEWGMVGYDENDGILSIDYQWNGYDLSFDAYKGKVYWITLSWFDSFQGYPFPDEEKEVDPPAEMLPAANDAAAFGEGDISLLGLILESNMSPDDVYQVLGEPPYIWRECEFGAVRYKKNQVGQYILYEIDIDCLMDFYIDTSHKLVLGMEAEMAPYEAIGRMFVREDGSDLAAQPWDGFDSLPADGWKSVQSGPQCGLTLFYYGFEPWDEDSVFNTDRFITSKDIAEIGCEYRYWMYLGLYDWGPETNWVVRQVIRYLGE